MHRTQIQMPPEQWTRLRRLAVERGVSVAELIREAVDSLLAGSDAARTRAIASIGGFRSGRGDVSEHHDDHLTDAFDT